MALFSGQRVIDLYRRTLREVPRIITVFDIDIPERDIRKDIRGLFDKHSEVKDPVAVDLLVVKGELDLEETVNIWKQKTHVMRLLGRDEEKVPLLKEYAGESEFLKKFYAGHTA